MKKIKVVLVGQPNVGKSMLINSISNAHLHTGNFSGVTVEKSEVSFKYKGYSFIVVDLPGTYALGGYSLEEKVTTSYLHEEDYDVILNVADSTNLEKNLSLTTELMSLDKKLVLALNMSDEAELEGVMIDSKQLSLLLGFKALKVSAKTKKGLDELLEAIIKTHEDELRANKLQFSEAVEEEIEVVANFLDQHGYKSKNSSTNIAINLLKGDKKTYNSLQSEPIFMELSPILAQSLKHIELHHENEDIKEVFASESASFNRGIAREVISYVKPQEQKSLTDKIDGVLLHKYFGIPIFLLLMWTLFQLTFTLGDLPEEYIEDFFVWIGEAVGGGIANDDLRSLVQDGLFAGVGAVITFVPNIAILFIGIALLETTGYMSRVAFLLDGFFHKFGLHGQSFIPLVTGFGCSIPAYMSARILKNDRDRLLTLFVIGFMSCGARLPIYVLFAGAFFSTSMAGNALFGIYISGAFIGLIAAKVLKLTAFKGADEPFVMEMPKYRLPSLKLIWHTVSTKTMMYLKKAGTFIAAASVLVWFLSNYPKNSALEEFYEAKIEQNIEQKVELNNELSEALLEQSYLGRIGKFTEPIFLPLGFDWKLSVALQAGLAAKEVVVSTLGVLYSLGEDLDEESVSLKNIISKNVSLPSAVSFIVVVMIYLPCLAASIVFTKEAGGIKYFFYLLAFTSIVAYVLALIAYNITSLITT
ncbi:MAG: ferrous iron transport protein B [Sulfurimonadaceae bacterium]|jgi:ferrous iron transport protein B|nr:ferrous iron transport protein B [Sulfurimonadaceae bacterium]